MSTDIIPYIVIPILVVIAIVLYIFLSVEYDDAFVENMLSFCAEKLIKFGRSNDEIYTKKGKIRTAIVDKISKKHMELYHFYYSPGIEMNFKKLLMKEGLLDENSVFLREKKKVYKRFLTFFQGYKEYLRNNKDDFITVEDFYTLKGNTTGDFVGVYILHNKTKDMFYVGQAKRILFRVSQHFTGHGNGDVYADYKYGDEFEVGLIKIVDTDFESVDEMEMYYIDLYDAAINGYNKTSGNKY